jgi:hypothetical protein
MVMPVLGQIKVARSGLDRFMLRRFEKVNEEELMATTSNLLKLIRALGPLKV